MTQVGHCITGAAIGVLTLPRGGGLPRRALHVGAFLLLAEIPDVGLVGWGHDRYHVSHSLFVNLLAIAAVAALLRVSGAAGRLGGGPVPLAGAAAWLSHLLLDTYYRDGWGLRMFWPFSSAALALPVPWFSTVVPGAPALDAANVRIYLIEAACYGPLLLLAWAARWACRRAHAP